MIESSRTGPLLSTERSAASDGASIGKGPDQIEKFSTSHNDLLVALSTSKALSALHVEIRNESYWYASRARLGPKRQGAMIVKYNESTLKHDAYIFKMKIRESDVEWVPQRVSVGSAKTKLEAYKLCEKACKERDENPARTRKMADVMPADKILSTHFRVLVVSEHFNHLPYIERLGLVFEALLSGIGVPLLPPSAPGGAGLGRSAPTRLRMGTTFGPAMCGMDLFRVLLPPDAAPFTLIIDPKTPSQWRPELYKPLVSERLGSSHVGLRTLQVDDAAKPLRQKKRLKQLTTTSSSDKLPRPSLAQQLAPPGSPPAAVAAPPIADSLGLDASVSGVRYKKLGGIYGHFFNDLSPAIREMVMLKYKDNKHLIQDEGNVNVWEVEEAKRRERARIIEHGYAALLDAPAADQTPHTLVSVAKAKAHAALHLPDYDKGTSTEAQMLEDITVASKKVERVAVRLQRIRRIVLFRRAIKRLWWRKYAAVCIQRIVRGKYGRQYAALFSKLRPIAAVRIQVCFRAMRTRVILKAWRYLTYRLTRVALPKIKRFIRNCFLSWIFKRDASAVVIQSIARQFLGRVQYYKRMGKRYLMKSVFPRAAVQMQKIVRGRFGRLRAKQQLAVILVQRVDQPAALRLQRIYRGRLAKKHLDRLRYEYQCLIRLQIFLRGCVHRIWEADLRRHQFIRACAVDIQRVYRGTLDRQRVRMMRYKLWYYNVYLPAIVSVQAVTRRYFALKSFSFRKTSHHAAKVIQSHYRQFVHRRIAKARMDTLRTIRMHVRVTRIQTVVRRYIAMCRLHRMKITYNGRVIRAAKVIMRAWVNFKINRKYQYMLQEHRHELYSQKIGKYISVRRNIQVDIKEIHGDVANAEKAIARLRDRSRQLETFLQQASVRSVNTKEEMQKLTTIDFEHGWAEALGQEYESINHQMLMAREELRLLRVATNSRQREVNNLNLELEEIEMEIDSIEVVETECAEGIRRTEIARAIKQADDRTARMVRQEKSHWRIESNRVNVIKRNRPRYQAIVSQTHQARDLAYATTISFEKHAQVWDKEDLTTDHLLRRDARKQDAENKPKEYQEYAGPVQDTYDKVVANTLSLLRGFTLDERTARMREQQQSKETKAKVSQRGQFAPLKPEFQAGGAFANVGGGQK